MYSSKLIDMIDNDEKKTSNEVYEVIHLPADEAADDVKIYIRHNADGIVKDFYEKLKMERASRKFQWE